MAEYKGVMVCGEIGDGKLAASTLELLGGGRGLADNLGEELSLVYWAAALATWAKRRSPLGQTRYISLMTPCLRTIRRTPT